MHALIQKYKVLTVFTWTIGLSFLALIVFSYALGGLGTRSVRMGLMTLLPAFAISSLSAIAAYVPKRGVHFLLCQGVICLAFIGSYFASLPWSAAPVPSDVPKSIRIIMPLIVFALLFAFGLWRSFMHAFSEQT